MRFFRTRAFNWIVVSTFAASYLANGSAPAADTQFGKRNVEIEGPFGEDWQQSIDLPASPHIAGGKVIVSVEDGWLCARRDSTDGQCEWSIVLCRADANSPPTMQVINDLPTFFEISCQDGRYFIRESAGILRALRESGSTEKLLAKSDLLGPDVQTLGYGGACSAWRDADWFFVTAGPDRESWQAFVRLDKMDTRGGYGVSTSVQGPTYYFHHDSWFIDDGELLVAKRLSLAAYEARKKHEAARNAILAGQLPAIDATNWLNSNQAPTWESLRGKVVLVDFWATWCGPCVAKLPDVQRQHEKYKDRGLAVIGIHSAQDADSCAEFLTEHGYTFPVALDAGKTAEGFAISGWPSYFLLDRTGKVVQSFSHNAPTDEAIEALLEGSRP